MIRELFNIFFTFFKIGAFTIGGAYAMIPLIQREVCQKRRWISEKDFLNGLAAAQSCPGPIAINLSVYIGFRVKRRKGIAMAVLGTVLPSTITIILIAILFTRYADNLLVRKAFHALRPAVVALIAVPLINLSRNAGLSLASFWIPLLAMVLVAWQQVSPLYLILVTIAFAVGQSLGGKGKLK